MDVSECCGTVLWDVDCEECDFYEDDECEECNGLGYVEFVKECSSCHKEILV